VPLGRFREQAQQRDRRSVKPERIDDHDVASAVDKIEGSFELRGIAARVEIRRHSGLLQRRIRHVDALDILPGLPGASGIGVTQGGAKPPRSRIRVAVDDQHIEHGRALGDAASLRCSAANVK
jgi:hypothetical protein